MGAKTAQGAVNQLGVEMRLYLRDQPLRRMSPPDIGGLSFIITPRRITIVIAMGLAVVRAVI